MRVTPRRHAVRFLATLALLIGGLGVAAPADAAEAGASVRAGEIDVPPGSAIDLTTGQAAAAALPICGSGRICFYDTALSITSYSASDTVTGCRDIPASMDNRTSYIVNASSRSWRVFVTGGCLGNSAHIYANSRGAMNSQWDNVISAFRRN